jgi:hypothetical protein
VDARETRLAENEVLFRDVNERVEAIAAVHGDDDHVYEFYCECSNVDCTLLVSATLKEYEQVRAHGSRFLIAPGHWLPEIERVVEEGIRHWVIEKTGDAADYVAERDPRDESS